MLLLVVPVQLGILQRQVGTADSTHVKVHVQNLWSAGVSVTMKMDLQVFQAFKLRTAREAETACFLFMLSKHMQVEVGDLVKRLLTNVALGTWSG
jgi:hypothetical protein